jgi:hypothetical protein
VSSSSWNLQVFAGLVHSRSSVCDRKAILVRGICRTLAATSTAHRPSHRAVVPPSVRAVCRKLWHPAQPRQI